MINQNTASAADGYMAAIKSQEVAIIIGTNSGGEGLGDSYVSHSLPNSGLVYIYYPAMSYNEDGTSNPSIGIEPDVYVEQTAESFFKEFEIAKLEEDCHSSESFENRLI